MYKLVVFREMAKMYTKTGGKNVVLYKVFWCLFEKLEQP
jgi:hypothetical protein